MTKKDIHTVRLSNVSLTHPSGKNVFEGISIDFPMNEIVWLKGVSGSGKSNLLKILSGLTMPTKGDYFINNDKVNEMTFEEFASYRRNIGYSFDFGGLISNCDIMRNMSLAAEFNLRPMFGEEYTHKKIMEYLQIFNLDKIAHERPSAISGGMRKAACVARAFINEPQLLLLDDPTTGLRGDTATNLKNLLLLKRAQGQIRHIIIASENSEFMKALHPLVVEVSQKSVYQMYDREAS